MVSFLKWSVDLSDYKQYIDAKNISLFREKLILLHISNLSHTYQGENKTLHGHALWKEPKAHIFSQKHSTVLSLI